MAFPALRFHRHNSSSRLVGRSTTTLHRHRNPPPTLPGPAQAKSLGVMTYYG